MKSLLFNPATAVWVVLMAATCSTFWLTERADGLRWASILMLLIAAAKVLLIMNHFMELNRAPWGWRLVLTSWLVGVTVILLFPYWR